MLCQVYVQHVAQVLSKPHILWAMVVIDPTVHSPASQSHPYSASSIILGHRLW